MRQVPTALGIVHADSDSADWDRAQVKRLARTMGYQVIWPADSSLLPLVDQARQADVDIVIVAALDTLTSLEINALMSVADVESVCPRLSFSRWVDVR